MTLALMLRETTHDLGSFLFVIQLYLLRPRLMTHDNDHTELHDNEARLLADAGTLRRLSGRLVRPLARRGVAMLI